MDPSVVDLVADAMEISAADPRQQAMITTYITDLALHDRARVLEIGCGTGAISRALSQAPGVGPVLGIDPSPILVARARELSKGSAALAFEEGDGRNLPLDDDRFDAVVIHRVLSHVPDPDAGTRGAVPCARPGRQAGGLRRRLLDDHPRHRRR